MLAEVGIGLLGALRGAGARREEVGVALRLLGGEGEAGLGVDDVGLGGGHGRGLLHDGGAIAVALRAGLLELGLGALDLDAASRSSIVAMTSPARTGWLSPTATAVTKPEMRGDTVTLSAWRKALSVVSWKRPTVHQLQP